jgi:hypothetical protein
MRSINEGAGILRHPAITGPVDAASLAVFRIHQFAVHPADEYRKEYGMEVEVRVDAIVSLNGGKPAPLSDPESDLAAQPRDPL